ncbi:MAG: uncharacterized protein KVP18_000427 [Porospora cf. gigantea A]|uniref:uncharacterized protein n=1 Tax=Porospora cf. gigantea A TaxID=2853593 RepID=UPI003559C0FC|nr:MAG: hypothetical protein KVP18_000427 [Porospora cf. gigantea A]
MLFGSPSLVKARHWNGLMKKMAVWGSIPRSFLHHLAADSRSLIRPPLNGLPWLLKTLALSTGREQFLWQVSKSHTTPSQLDLMQSLRSDNFEGHTDDEKRDSVVAPPHTSRLTTHCLTFSIPSSVPPSPVGYQPAPSSGHPRLQQTFKRLTKGKTLELSSWASTLKRRIDGQIFGLTDSCESDTESKPLLDAQVFDRHGEATLLEGGCSFGAVKPIAANGLHVQSPSVLWACVEKPTGLLLLNDIVCVESADTLELFGEGATFPLISSGPGDHFSLHWFDMCVEGSVYLGSSVFSQAEATCASLRPKIITLRLDDLTSKIPTGLAFDKVDVAPDSTVTLTVRFPRPWWFAFMPASALTSPNCLFDPEELTDEMEPKRLTLDVQKLTLVATNILTLRESVLYVLSWRQPERTFLWACAFFAALSLLRHNPLSVLVLVITVGGLLQKTYVRTWTSATQTKERLVHLLNRFPVLLLLLPPMDHLLAPVEHFPTSWTSQLEGINPNTHYIYYSGYNHAELSVLAEACLLKAAIQCQMKGLSRQRGWWSPCGIYSNLLQSPPAAGAFFWDVYEGCARFMNAITDWLHKLYVLLMISCAGGMQPTEHVLRVSPYLACDILRKSESPREASDGESREPDLRSLILGAPPKKSKAADLIGLLKHDETHVDSECEQEDVDEAKITVDVVLETLGNLLNSGPKGSSSPLEGLRSMWKDLRVVADSTFASFQRTLSLLDRLAVAILCPQWDFSSVVLLGVVGVVGLALATCPVYYYAVYQSFERLREGYQQHRRVYWLGTTVIAELEKCLVSTISSTDHLRDYLTGDRYLFHMTADERGNLSTLVQQSFGVYIGDLDLLYRKYVECISSHSPTLPFLAGHILDHRREVGERAAYFEQPSWLVRMLSHVSRL